MVAYNTWRQLREDDPRLSWEDQGIRPGDRLATPALRLQVLATGQDLLIENGAYSLAWRRDGAIAYVRGVEEDYRAGVRYLGEVVVRSSLDAPADVWTVEPAYYVVLGWAGDHLLVYQIGQGEHIDLLVLDGPRRVRMLAAGATVIAISPDGGRVFIEEGAESGRPVARILDVADGHEVARIDLSKATDPATSSPVGAVSYAGDWAGDLVVARGGPGLVLFRIEPERIVVEQTLIVKRKGFPLGATEPRFADQTGNRIIAQADVPAVDAAQGDTVAVFLDCDRLARRCLLAEPVPAAAGVNGFGVWRRLVYNPSRPAEGGQ